MGKPEQKLVGDSQRVEIGQKAKDIAKEALVGVANDLDSIRVIGHVPYKDGCCWHRVYRPLTYLKQSARLGQFETSNVLAFKEWIATHPRPFNTIINQRIFGAVPLALTRSFGWMTMLECDDDYWSLTKKNPAHRWLAETPQFLPYFAATIPHAWGVVVSTPELVKKFNALGAKRVFHVPNGLDFNGFKDVAPNTNGKVRIGWAGSGHHVDDMEQVINVLKRLKQTYGDKIELVFMGWCPPQLKGIVEYHESVAVEKYEYELQMLNLDISIAPLLNSKFNRSKSNLKFLEYSACCLPTIASDVECYSEIVDGKTGLLVHTQKDWYGALTFLIDNPDKRVDIGIAANLWAQENYDMSVTSKCWLNTLQANHKFQQNMFRNEDALKNKIAESLTIYQDALRRCKFHNKVRTKIRRKTKNAKRKSYNTRLPF